MNYAGRLRRLCEQLGHDRYDAVLVSSPANIRYLTGYAGSNALVVAGPGGATLLTDFRYLQAVAPMREFMEVRQVQQELLPPAAQLLAEMLPAGGRGAFEAQHLSQAAYTVLAEHVGGGHLVSAHGLVEQLRMVKEAEELDAIRQAAALLEHVYAALAEQGLSGRREVDVAWRVRELLHEMGAEPAFETIVASGEAGAMPHAVPREHVIDSATLVTIDAGARLHGYCSDCTRSFATAPLPPALAEIYQVCLAAQLTGVEAVREGAVSGDVDAAVRAVIAGAGYGEQFQHGTGHGVGLEIHEAPRLARDQTATLAAGMVVTVEPGIYLPELGGVRIEDLLIVTAEGAERLTGYPKELITSG